MMENTLSLCLGGVFNTLIDMVKYISGKKISSTLFLVLMLQSSIEKIQILSNQKKI